MFDLTGLTSLISCAAVFGISSILIRILSSELSDLGQAMARMLLAGLIALNIFIVNRKPLDLKRVKAWQLIIFAFAFPLIVIFLTVSINLIKVASAIFYLYVGKILAAVLLDIFVFKEKMNLKRSISIILLISGLLFFLNPFAEGFTLSLGIIFGLIAGVIASVDAAFRKVLSGLVDRWFLVWMPMLTGSALCFVIIYFQGEDLNPIMSNNSFYILILSGALMIAAQMLMLIGFKHIDINLGTIILSSELIFTMIFAVFFFQEIPAVNEIIGSGFVIAAILNRNLKIK